MERIILSIQKKLTRMKLKSGLELLVIGVVASLLVATSISTKSLFSSSEKFDFLTEVQAPNQQLSVEMEIANTPELRNKGLSGRPNLPSGKGMLFIYEVIAVQCMWAKDMKFDVDVAFVNEEGAIVNIEHMKAGSIDPHCSAEPVRKALEMNSGAFNKKT